MRLDYKRIVTYNKRKLIVGGLVIIVHQPCIERIGFESMIALIPPHKPMEGRNLKYWGKKWYTPYEGQHR